MGMTVSKHLEYKSDLEYLYENNIDICILTSSDSENNDSSTSDSSTSEDNLNANENYSNKDNLNKDNLNKTSCTKINFNCCSSKKYKFDMDFLQILYEYIM